MSGAVSGPALEFGGNVLAGAGAFQAEQFNADVAREQRRLAQERGRFAEARARERAKRFRGTQRAAVGASGTTFTGSPLLVIAEAAEDAELEALAIRFQTQTEIDAAEARRDAAQFQGGMALLTGLISAAPAGARLLGRLGGGSSVPRFNQGGLGPQFTGTDIRAQGSV